MIENLVVRRRKMHGQSLWWVGNMIGKDFVFYSDVHAPTGYGFKSKTRALRTARDIEQSKLNSSK